MWSGEGDTGSLTQLMNLFRGAWRLLVDFLREGCVSSPTTGRDVEPLGHSNGGALAKGLSEDKSRPGRTLPSFLFLSCKLTVVTLLCIGVFCVIRYPLSSALSITTCINIHTRNHFISKHCLACRPTNILRLTIPCPSSSGIHLFVRKMAPPSKSKPRRASDRSRRSSTSTSSSSNRSTPTHTNSRLKSPIYINVYDLMPPSTLSTILWPLGLSLLHIGIVLLDREYAYGATTSLDPSQPQTGIFHTPPLTLPPGGTHRLTHLQGFTYLSKNEIEQLLHDASSKFVGENYNLVMNNCNHFTNHMCRILTGQDMPSWVNRAARVGMVLPCLIPTEWMGVSEASGMFEIEGVGTKKSGSGVNSTYGAAGPEDAYTSSSDEEGDQDERTGMMLHQRRQASSQKYHTQQYFDDPEDERKSQTIKSANSVGGDIKTNDNSVRDPNGIVLPPSERATPPLLI